MSKKGEFWNTCRGTIKDKDRISFSREKLALHINRVSKITLTYANIFNWYKCICTSNWFHMYCNYILVMYLVSEIYYFFVTFIYKIKVEISTCNVKKYMYCQFQVLHTKVGDVPLLGSACHAFVWGRIVELTANSEHTADVGASIKVRFTNQSLSTMALSRYKLISNWQSRGNTTTLYFSCQSFNHCFNCMVRQCTFTI